MLLIDINKIHAEQKIRSCDGIYKYCRVVASRVKQNRSLPLIDFQAIDKNFTVGKIAASITKAAIIFSVAS
jgi:hypothetical protein